MRRTLTTLDTWNIIAVIAAAIAIAIAGMWYWSSRTSSQTAFAVKSNGKVLVTADEWATVQAKTTKFAKISPGHELTLDELVQQKLEYAEAERRGTVCTQVEAATRMKEGDDLLLNSGDPGALKFAIYNVENAGVVPPGYSLTPEAQRTPTLGDALKALESDPKTVEGYRKTCSRGKLYASLATDGTVQTQNANVSALDSKLRSDANLEYGIAATPTP